MKQRVFAWLLVLILALTPVLAFAEGGDADEALAVDTERVYPGMDKSISAGFIPKEGQKDVRFLLPLIGTVAEDTVRVTVKFPADGTFDTGELTFDVAAQTYEVTNAAGGTESAKAYLIDCTVPLSASHLIGTYLVRFVVAYRTAAGETAEQTFPVLCEIAKGKKNEKELWSTPVEKPILLIESGVVTPQDTVGNDTVTIDLAIVNAGQKEARNICINAEPQDKDVVLSSDLNGIYIDRLAANETTAVRFDLRVARHALEGDHLVKIGWKYEGKFDGEYKGEASYCVHVAQPVELAYDAVKLPETMTGGDTFTQIIYVYNPSCATAYNVRGVLNVDGLICSSAYLGSIAPQGEATKELPVFVTTLSGSQKYGDTWGSFELHYEDENGEEQILFQDLKGTILEPEKITDEEKERQEKEQKEQQTLSQWWISLLVAIAVIIILVAIIVIARFARMMQMR